MFGCRCHPAGVKTASLPESYMQSIQGQRGLHIVFLANPMKNYLTSFMLIRKPSAAAVAKLLQLCPTLYDPTDGGSPGSAIPGIFQARTLEWVAISFFNAWKWKVKVKSLSCVLLFVTSWTAAYQAPLSMGFSRQAYWSGLPLPSPRKPSSVDLNISKLNL